MNRRNFFSNLFRGIVATSIAPSIIIPRFEDHQIWKTPYGSEIPEVKLILKSEPIVAKVRKLKAVWTCELEHDLLAYHDIDAEKEITSILKQHINKNII